ncbi:MAG: SAM-dependent methyltransferase [Coriobacteriia bacterium]|nr:SAM-dependent methyltransferase [Coriobacteriia bacterium]
MSRFALLILPSANRVYAEASLRMSCAELGVLNETVFSQRLGDVGVESIGGVSYVTFSAEEIGERDALYLSNLSACYALFEMASDGSLRPITVKRLDRFDDDLVTIQKYPGKTNEQFTKLLLNVTLLASDFRAEMLDRKFLVMDPLCGRGTALNQALMYGFDASGIDIDQKDFDAYSTFMKTYLKRKRMKHKAQAAPVRTNGRVVGRRFDVTLAESKEQYALGDTLQLTVVNADTTKALDFFPAGKADVLVADAPYGVQHASRTAHRGHAKSPLDLLAAAVPVWTRLLRTGGAMGIAWNVHVAKRSEAAAILEAAGLRVMNEGPYLEFEHWVEQAITRDILVAVKQKG